MSDSTNTPTNKDATQDTAGCPVDHSNNAPTNTTYDQGDNKGPTIHSENVDKSHAPQRPSMGGCPVIHQAHTTTASAATDWWPNSLNLDILHQQDKKTDPMGADFDYNEAFKQLDLEAVKTDLKNLTAIPVDHFGRFTSWMAVRDDAEIRQYGRAFMELCQKQFNN